MPKHLSTLSIILILIVAGVGALAYPRGAHHPLFKIETVERIQLIFLLAPQATASRCASQLEKLQNSVDNACPDCRIKEASCLLHLPEDLHRLYSDATLDVYSARFPNGSVIYQSADESKAAAACKESEKQITTSGQIICYPPGTTRPSTEPSMTALTGHRYLLLLMISFAGSCFTCWLIIRSEPLHAHLTHDATSGGPQKFHTIPTPRVGGIAVTIGIMLGIAGSIVLSEESTSLSEKLIYLVAASLPAFLGGLTEDVTKKVDVVDRLLLTMVSGVLGTWLLGAVINKVDLSFFDLLLTHAPFALLFTAFAVGGVANAINIIDGYNGLAAGFGVIVFSASAFIAHQVNDPLIFAVCVLSIGSLLGFLVWNWPLGRIFLGDGGSYLMGFLLAICMVLLVARNPQISPWTALALLTYPIFETLFSIYRKQWIRGRSAGKPDGLHLHMLIYKRVTRRFTKKSGIISRNSWVLPLLLLPMSIVIAVIGYWWESATVSGIAAVVTCVLYLVIYSSLLKRAFAIRRQLPAPPP